MAVVSLILFALTAYNLALIWFVTRRTHARHGGRSFIWYLAAVACWTCCCALIMLPGLGREATVWLVRAAFCCGTLVGLGWLYFCADLDHPTPGFGRSGWLIGGLGLPWLILAWTPWIVATTDQPLWSLHIRVAAGIYPFIAWVLAAFAGGIMHLVSRARRMSGLERLQAQYILIGTSVMTGVAVLVNLVLPAVSGASQYAYFGPMTSVILTTVTAYAITRYRLMDTRMILRYVLVYLLTVGCLFALLILLEPMFSSLMTRVRIGDSAIGILLAFLLALAFHPLRLQVEEMLLRRIPQLRMHDHRQTIREIVNALAGVQSREPLIAFLAKALDQAPAPVHMSLYLPGYGDTYVQAWSQGEREPLPRVLPAAHPLLIYAMRQDDVLITEELVRARGTLQYIGARLSEWEVEAVLPLVADGRLCGLIALGEKRSGDIYTSEELALLRILGKQTAIALENTRHFDEIVLLNEYHERLLSAMQDGVIALDPGQRIITFNPPAERLTGVRMDMAIGKQMDEIGIRQLSPADTGGTAVEMLLETPAGDEVPVIMTVTPFRRRGEEADSHLLVIRDMSALKLLEQEKMQAERFSSMGAMAASLAHEIKNPLVPIQTFAHLLPEMYDDEEFRREFSSTVVEEVGRIDRLVGEMLDLVRNTSSDNPDLVNLRGILHRLLVLVRPDCQRNGIQVQTQFPPEAPEILGVAGQLYQAILNILVNAIQAMPDGGELSVSIETTGQNLVCRITDTGPGVPPAQLSRIFEPMYTTKPGGHGLGLALTSQFIRTNHGDITADSAPGRGLTFTLTFPIPEQQEEGLAGMRALEAV